MCKNNKLLSIFYYRIITALIFRHSEVSDCGQFLIVCPQEGCRDNLVYFANLDDMSKEGCLNSTLNLSQVVYKFEHDYEVCITCILLLNTTGFISNSLIRYPSILHCNISFFQF